MVLRIILLKRIAHLNAGCFDDDGGKMPEDTQGPWILLGHFDSMYTWQPHTSEDFFNVVRSNSEMVADLNSGTAYYHPIYLIDEESVDGDEENNFWASNRWFVSVERVHFSQPIFSKELVRCLSQELNKQAVAMGCQIRIYRTLELSDIVVAVHSDRMDKLLEFSLSLQKRTCIGKVYTYVGISYRNLCAQASPEEEDCIPMLSMRFSVSHFEEAMTLLKDGMESVLGKRMGVIYSITGVDDLAVNWTEFPVCKLISLYRNWFLPDTGSQSTENTPFGKAFWEVISRVGIQASEPQMHSEEQCNGCDRWYDKENIGDAQTILLNASNKLAEQLRSQLGKSTVIREANWYQPLAELTKSLVRLCQTPVLDELVFLLLPGAQAFIKNIAVCSNRALSDQETEKCNYFVEKWSHLVEHVMRMEGQLTQYPDTRPILYSIPMVMLEYMMAFVNQVTRVLQGKQSAGHSFLLVPQMSQQVQSLEMFIAKEQDKMPGLVVVTLPLRTLYDPITVQMELCHEICHFVGEEHRMRKERINYFAHAAAVLIAKSIFGTYHDGLIRVMERKISGKIQIQCGDTVSPPIIREMDKIVTDWVNELFTNYSKEYADLLFQVLDDIQKKGAPPFRLEIGINDAGLTAFNMVLKDLSILFREVYADICMMFLLDGDSDTYVESIGTVLAGSDISNTKEAVTYEPETLAKWRAPDQEWERRKYTEPLAIRIYVTLKVLGKQKPIPCNGSDGYTRLFTEISKLDKELCGEEESVTRLIPLGSIDALIEYGQQCYQGLQNTLGNDPQLVALREQMKKTSSHNMMYNSIISAIQKDRKTMVTELAQGK